MSPEEIARIARIHAPGHCWCGAVHQVYECVASRDSRREQGAKFDSGKPRFGLLPTDALREVAKVLTFGAQKYAPRNWEKGIAYERVYSALQRHLSAWWEREETDPETGINHLAHAGCCVLFLLAYALRDVRQFDDRPTHALKEGTDP